MEATNEGLARYVQIKKHVVLPLMLSIDDGTLSASLKGYRRVVERQFTAVSEGMFEGT